MLCYKSLCMLKKSYYYISVKSLKIIKNLNIKRLTKSLVNFFQPLGWVRSRSLPSLVYTRGICCLLYTSRCV